MRSIKYSLLALLVFLSGNIHAGDWKFGSQFAHATGLSDVTDQYRANLRAQGLIVFGVDPLPVAIGFKSRFEAESGIQFGIDVGPFFTIYGDTSHYELPLNATVGYSFFKDSTVSPFVRLGASYHIASGDFVSGSTPGLFASVGTDIGKNWGIEIAVDESVVELDVISTGGVVEINSYDVIFSVFSLF